MKPLKGCGPLACFKRKKHAKTFLNDVTMKSPIISIGFKIFRIKYKKSIYRRLFYDYYNYSFSTKMLKDCFIPKGTKFARKIKLIKELIN